MNLKYFWVLTIFNLCLLICPSISIPWRRKVVSRCSMVVYCSISNGTVLECQMQWRVIDIRFTLNPILSIECAYFNFPTLHVPLLARVNEHKHITDAFGRSSLVFTRKAVEMSLITRILSFYSLFHTCLSATKPKNVRAIHGNSFKLNISARNYSNVIKKLTRPTAERICIMVLFYVSHLMTL